MPTRIASSGPVLSLDQVREFEVDCGISLPEEYVLFMLRHNGGNPVPNGFSFIRHGRIEHSAVVRLTPLLGGSHNVADEMGILQGRIPEDAVPIGHDPCGNVVCLRVAGDEFGRLCLWDHEEEFLNESGEIRNVYPIQASGFDEFLATLRALDEDEEESPARDDLTALVEANDAKGLERAVARGLDIAATNAQGLSLVMLAAAAGKVAILEALLDRGADASRGVELAAAHDRPDALELLMRRGVDVDERSGDQGRTPLAIAAGRGSEAALRVLLSHGADVNAVDAYGYTALDRAIFANQTGAERLLVDAGGKRGYSGHPGTV